MFTTAVCLIPRQLTTFKGAAKAIKLFAKHIKVFELKVLICDVQELCTVSVFVRADRGADEAAAEDCDTHRSWDTWQDQCSH